MLSEVQGVLDSLKSDLAKVLALRFGLTAQGRISLRDCGVQVPKADGTPRSPSRIQQMEAHALRLLRHPAKSPLVFELSFCEDLAVRRFHYAIVGGSPRRFGLVSRAGERRNIENQAQRRIESIVSRRLLRAEMEAATLTIILAVSDIRAGSPLPSRS